MTVSSPHTPRRHRRCAAVAGLVVSLCATGVSLIAATPASATTLDYVGSTSGTQSTVVIHKGDAHERTIHPTGRVTATLDDTAKKVIKSDVNFDPTWTDIQVVAGLKVYTRTDMTQVGSATGSSAIDANGNAILSVKATTRLGMTVYVSKDGTKKPDTDEKLAEAAKCYVDMPLTLAGSANRRTGAMSLAVDPFTIPYFGSVAGTTCGWATGDLNTQMAGTKNSLALNFTGGATTAHYTGITKGTQSRVTIKNGDAFLQRNISPSGTMSSDINFATHTVTNARTIFRPTTVSALPPVLNFIPAYATIAMLPRTNPVVTMSASAKPGIDKITAKQKIRMSLAIVFGTGDDATAVTDPAKCFVDIDLSLTGTADRGTDTVALSQSGFTIPAFPSGCGALSELMTFLVSGSNNTISLNFTDGVLA